ncbi:unnamed protein product, partial [Adineta ricciae]
INTYIYQLNNTTYSSKNVESTISNLGRRYYTKEECEMLEAIREYRPKLEELVTQQDLQALANEINGIPTQVPPQPSTQASFEYLPNTKNIPNQTSSSQTTGKQHT